MWSCIWIEASALVPYTFQDSTCTFNFFGNYRSYSSKRVNITCSRRFTCSRYYFWSYVSMLLVVFLLLFMWEVFDRPSSCCYALPKINQDCLVLIITEWNKGIVQFNVSVNKPSGVQIWYCLSQLQCYVAPNCLWKMQWLAMEGSVHCECFIVYVIITHD